ncbi:hypothetical protein OH76DRAFT_1557533 [Lentinus brumalis]|uniref:MYND-type domain-containing protein n=1 Tax=Lentinus brumalis TaxID=2498619 RepID=A0A371D5B9_9APHY|nr:hypothetical protein OH76DRAFT_1557533 [Polyporus brumalis]
MFSFSRVIRAPFRLLTSPRLHEGLSGLALGRSHASWFLVYSTRRIPDRTRAVMCLNFLIPGDPHSVGARSPAGRPIFTVGGSPGFRVMETLLSLRDEHGVAPIAVAKEHSPKRDPVELIRAIDKHPYMLLADIEVLLPESELIKVCAHCGKWETFHGPRFMRCGGCKSRHYCSEECQMDDWKPQYHEGECELLSAGKAYEAESRRKLHNNGWYWDYAETGDQMLLADNGIHTLERAMRELDVEEFAYGRRYPPHDVPPLRRRRALPPPWHADKSGYPPGFVPTGDADLDADIHEEYCTRMRFGPNAELTLGPPATAPDCVPLDALPKYPRLPKFPGVNFVPTGDPFLDEASLSDYLMKNGTFWQRKRLVKIVNARVKSYLARERLAAERKERWDKVFGAVEAVESDSDVAPRD